MEEIKLEIGKHYKTKDGRIIFIKDGLPPIDNKKDGYKRFEPNNTILCSVWKRCTTWT